MDDLTNLSTRLEQCLARLGSPLLRRAIVVRETASTQDFARMMAEASAGGPGLVVAAGRQTSGRGRLGRSWADTSHLGLALTAVLDAGAFSPEQLSIAAGVAACAAAEKAAGVGRVGLRWPNDVVERRDKGPGRKLAGVLIEQARDLMLLGIGINVLQGPEDWEAELRDRVVSLRELGAGVDRTTTAERLLEELVGCLLMPGQELAAQWTRRDVLVGLEREFIHNGQVYRGVVEAIEPTSHVRLRVADGEVVLLPALTTSLVWE